MKKGNKQREFAVGLVRQLREAGHTAYFAGGCVRDGLLGKEPKDYDVATSALPFEVEALFPRCKGVGAHFGVMLVRNGGHNFEIATFRSDGEYRDGRRPEGVTFSGEADDAQRRDFTINGMFFDPIAQKVVDYVEGQKDLSAGILRAIGNPGARFREDHLRMLRAVRFATTLDFEIEAATFSAIQQHADAISKISAERVRDEISRIFVGSGRVRGFDLLVETGLMAHIFPEILQLQGCEQPPQFHPEGDVFVHTRLMLSLLPEIISLPLVLSVLFHDIGKPATYSYDEANERIRFNGHDKVGAEMADGILRRLRYPGKVISECVEMIANHMVFKDVQKMRTSKIKRFMARETFEEEMELHRVDCLGSWGGLDNHLFLRQKQAEFAAEPLIPPRLVTGADLIARGWKPGPRFSEILTEIQNLQLEGSVTTREAALAWLANQVSGESVP